MRRICPSRADSMGEKLFSNGSPANVTAFEVWEIMPGIS